MCVDCLDASNINRIAVCRLINDFDTLVDIKRFCELCSRTSDNMGHIRLLSLTVVANISCKIDSSKLWHHVLCSATSAIIKITRVAPFRMRNNKFVNDGIMSFMLKLVGHNFICSLNASTNLSSSVKSKKNRIIPSLMEEILLYTYIFLRKPIPFVVVLRPIFRPMWKSMVWYSLTDRFVIFHKAYSVKKKSNNKKFFPKNYLFSKSQTLTISLSTVFNCKSCTNAKYDNIPISVSSPNPSVWSLRPQFKTLLIKKKLLIKIKKNCWIFWAFLF